MDEGDIIEIRKTPIEPLENSTALLARLAAIGAPLLSDTLHAIEAGTATRTPQDPVQSNAGPDALEGTFAHRLDESLSGTSSIRCAALIRGPSPRRT